MNLQELEKKLVGAARTKPADDRVPYAFEKRIMEHLKLSAITDGTAIWARALWRAVAPCFAVMVLLAGFAWFSPNATSSTNDFAQEIDNTLLATATQEQVNEASW